MRWIARGPWEGATVNGADGGLSFERRAQLPRSNARRTGACAGHSEVDAAVPPASPKPSAAATIESRANALRCGPPLLR
jgi:hypothetical protein